MVYYIYILYLQFLCKRMSNTYPVLHNARLMSFVERFLKGVVQNWRTAENGRKPLHQLPCQWSIPACCKSSWKKVTGSLWTSSSTSRHRIVVRHRLKLNWFSWPSLDFWMLSWGQWMHVLHWANPSWHEFQLGTLPFGLVMSIQLVVGEVTFRIYLSNQAIMPWRRRG